MGYGKRAHCKLHHSKSCLPLRDQKLWWCGLEWERQGLGAFRRDGGEVGQDSDEVRVGIRTLEGVGVCLRGEGYGEGARG